MNRFLILLLMVMSSATLSAPVFTSANVHYVYGGYSDGAVLFVPIGSVSNPAGCANPTAYVMQPDHDVKAAFSILLSAKLSGSTVHFSVRGDVCHTAQQTDGTYVYPVIQRVGVN